MTKLDGALVAETLIPPRDLPELVRHIREAQGMNQEEAARVLGVAVDSIVQAESQTYQGRLRVRKKILEAFAGFTLEGPYYRLTRLEEGE